MKGRRRREDEGEEKQHKTSWKRKKREMKQEEREEEGEQTGRKKARTNIVIMREGKIGQERERKGKGRRVIQKTQ